MWLMSVTPSVVSVARWVGDIVGLATNRSQVRVPAAPLHEWPWASCSHTCASVTRSSINWYRSMDGDICGWEGNRRSGHASQTQWYIHLQAQWPVNGRWAPRLSSTRSTAPYLPLLNYVGSLWASLCWSRQSLEAERGGEDSDQWRRQGGDRVGRGACSSYRGRTGRPRRYLLVSSLLVLLLLSPVSTTRVDGPSWRVTGFHYTLTRTVLTGNGNRSPVNSGSGNWALPDHDSCEEIRQSSNSVVLDSVSRNDDSGMMIKYTLFSSANYVSLDTYYAEIMHSMPYMNHTWQDSPRTTLH